MRYEREIPANGQVKIFANLEDETPTVDLLSDAAREAESKIPWGFRRVGPQPVLVIRGRLSIETTLKYGMANDEAARLLDAAGFEY